MTMDGHGPVDEAGGSPGRAQELLKKAAIVLAAVGLCGMSVVMVAVAIGTDEPPTVGADGNGPLRPGASISVRTDAGAAAQVLIRSVHGSASAPEIALTVTGVCARALQTNACTFKLDDGTEIAAQVTPGNGEFLIRPAGDIPAGRVARFLRFDPDDSRGDMYFEFQ